MTKKNDNMWKAVAITAIWITYGVVCVKTEFLSIGLGIIAFLATYTVTEA